MATLTRLPPVETWTNAPELAAAPTAPAAGISNSQAATPAEEPVYTGPGAAAYATYLRNKLAANEGLTPDDLVLAKRVGVLIPPQAPRIRPPPAPAGAPAPAGPPAP